jgi:hypothetical protein
MDETILSAETHERLAVFGVHTAAPLPAGRAEALWRSALANSSPPPRSVVRPLVALMAAAVAGGFITWGLFAAVRRTAVGLSPAAVASTSGSIITLPPGQTRIRAGRESVTIVTPHLELRLIQTAVLCDVTADGTAIVVESGEVTWRGKKVATGERFEVRAVALAAPLAIASAGAVVEGCDRQADAEAYEQCLARAAAGSGLPAEIAVYELGLRAHQRGELEIALRHFMAYRERFPDGSFAPEVSIATMLELKAQGRDADARAEASRFLTAFPGDPRRSDVRSWSEALR